MARYVAYSKITCWRFSHVAQAKFSEQDLQRLSENLGVDLGQLRAEIGPHWFPQRSLGPIPPTDPVIYRLHEVST